MSNKIDRRVVRTRRLLRGALLSLIRERGFDVITVQDITERATLNRATFYLHYADKHDLLLQVIRETLVELTDLPAPPAPSDDTVDAGQVREFFVAVFQHVIDHAEFYRVMFSAAGSGDITTEIYGTIHKVGMWMLARSGVRGWHIPPDVVMSGVTGAYLGMVRWMVSQPTLPDPGTMADQFTALVLPGIIGAIQQ